MVHLRRHCAQRHLYIRQSIVLIHDVCARNLISNSRQSLLNGSTRLAGHQDRADGSDTGGVVQKIGVRREKFESEQDECLRQQFDRQSIVGLESLIEGHDL